MDLGIKGRVALVTGGSKGIGRTIAEVLADEGARVAICARSQDVLEEAARALTERSGQRVLPIVADMRDASAIDRMVTQIVETFGSLEILVNNAGAPGGTAAGPLERLGDVDLFNDFDTKYMGYVRCTRAAAPHMKKAGWGRILFIGGTSGREAGNYSSGIRNLALTHLAGTLAQELGPSGITANVIHPGTTRAGSDWLELKSKREHVSLEEAERRAGSNAIRRPVDPEEVARLAAFLASEAAGSITAETIAISGGSSRSIFI